MHRDTLQFVHDKLVNCACGCGSQRKEKNSNGESSGEKKKKKKSKDIHENIYLVKKTHPFPDFDALKQTVVVVVRFF